MRDATHWVTARDWPQLVLRDEDRGTGLTGRPVGRVGAAAPFVFDPIEAYRAGLVTNPNMVVAGAMGSGKSTVVKMLVRRALERGHRVVVVDPKGEYDELAAHCGLPVFRPGRDAWLSPFGMRPLTELTALVTSVLGRPLTPAEWRTLSDDLAGVGPPWPVDLLRALEAKRARETDAVSHVVHRFVHGDLAGVFSGAGDPLVTAGAGFVASLARHWSHEALPTVALGVLSAVHRENETRPTLLVADEAWALFDNPSTVAWLRGSWKLARATATSHVLVLHQWRDVDATTRTQGVDRAALSSLLRENENWWLFRQGADDVTHLTRHVGLSGAEAAVLTALPRGRVLVRYGSHRSVVTITPDHEDEAVIDTDGAFRSSAEGSLLWDE